MLAKIVCWIEGHKWDYCYKNNRHVGQRILLGKNDMVRLCLRCKRIENIKDGFERILNGIDFELAML